MRKKFSPTSRQLVSVSPEELIKMDYLRPDQRQPLVIQPAAGRLDLVAWARSNRQLIEARLLQHGALLFRNFDVESAEKFEEFIQATSGGLLAYTERSSPRSRVSGRIYTSTDYPAAQRIFLHNENSYQRTFPLKIFFHCVTAAQEGGETPIADTRQIFRRLAPEIRARLAEKQYLYVRNFSAGTGLSWQTTFQTMDKTVVEAYCGDQDIECEWLAGDRLRTRQVREVAAKHPRTGEMVWFNHLTFFHLSTLEPAIQEALMREYNEADLPNHTYYGDGSSFEPSLLESLRGAYEAEKICFRWQEKDILMLDNMLTAHGREPFTGSRKVLVGMSEPWTRVIR